MRCPPAAGAGPATASGCTTFATRCTLKARADWKPIKAALTGPTEFTFNTGGPAVASVQPYDGAQIDEDQFFLLRLSGAVVETSVTANARCEVEGIGERITVRVVGGEPRAQLLKARRIDATQAARTLVLGCQRPLPNGAALRLGFSAPVPREWAAKVRLTPASPASPGSASALAPVFDKDDTATDISALTLPTPLSENAAFTLSLPGDLKDNAGRVLANAASFPLKLATGAAPPIAKFAAAPFGVIEAADPVLPVTLRHVQGDLRSAAVGR